jgi:NAD(P)-dependent dehydrogenase (short-subunit alcohol dehydrogenase family)
MASVLVTGGSGIARGVIDAFVAYGAQVTVLERSPDRAAEVRVAYGDIVVEGDALDPAALAAAVARMPRLDTLVTCVGVHDQGACLAGMSLDALAAAYDECFRANVLSVLLAVRAALPRLAESRGSVIVTLSEAAYRAGGGGVLYGAAKWALRGVVQHLAKELAPEVRVNGVAPGGTGGTRLAGLASLGQRRRADQRAGRDEAIRAATALDTLPLPEDHAPAYVYLAGARVVTGTVINSDAGSRL